MNPTYLLTSVMLTRCASNLGNRPSQLHGWITLSLIEEYSQSMAQYLTQQATVQAPAISGPDSFDLVAVGQLPESGVDTIPQSTEPSATHGTRVLGGIAERRFPIHSLEIHRLIRDGRIPLEKFAESYFPKRGKPQTKRKYTQRSFRWSKEQ